MSARGPGTTFSRRRVLLAGAGLAGAGIAAAAGLGGDAVRPRAGGRPAKPRDPRRSGIDHIVVVMMENRSFDHYLGWLDGADGRQAGLAYTDRSGVRHATHHLADFQGCAFADPDHTYRGGRAELNGGACDGWLRAGANDRFCIGYYEAGDLPFHRHAARDWTVCDRYFAATMADTHPNRFYLHSAQTDRISDAGGIATMPTIWDRLAAAGIPGRYYFSDVPFLVQYGLRYLGISAPFTRFLDDAAAGRLPAVSFVDPAFIGEQLGTSTDEHPHGDIRAGQAFLAQVYRAVTTGPAWPRSVLVITYDEWGGFFDHVPPAIAPDARPDLGTGLRGFRVPCVVISPWARRGHVAHGTYDHTSVLKMIEWRFGLAPLTVRDAAAANLAEVLDLAHPPDVAAPAVPVPPFTPQPCPTGRLAAYRGWGPLAARAAALGFPRGGEVTLPAPGTLDPDGGAAREV